MLSTHDDVDIWSAHPDFPDEPAFYRAVLDALPTPVLVIDDEGLVVYGNRAVMEMSGRTKEEGVQTSVFEYVHPDDLAMIAQAFLEIDLSNRPLDREWAPIRCRMVRADGSAFPVQVTGRNRLADSDIGAVIYHVAPADDATALTEVLRSDITVGAESFAPVFSLAGLKLLAVDIAILVYEHEHQQPLVFSREPELAQLLTAGLRSAEMSWADVAEERPRYLPAASLTGQVGRDLRDAGALDVWVLDVPTSAFMPRCTIVGITPEHNVTQLGVMESLNRAAELTSVVLLRAHSVR